MDANALIQALRCYTRAVSRTDAQCFTGDDRFQNLFPELYVKGPPKVVMLPEEIGPFRRKMQERDALEDILNGCWPSEKELFDLFGCSRAEIEDRLRQMNPIVMPIPDKTIVLSFDDASNDHIRFAAPLLKELGFGATFFVAELNDPVRGRYFADKEHYMTWEEIKELSDMGFEIGNHTLHHRMSAGDTFVRAEFLDEVNSLNEKCESYGIPRPVSFGYPKGACTTEHVDAAREAGFLWGRGNVSDGVCATNGAVPYNPLVDSPLSMPSYGDAPVYTYSMLERRASMARGGKAVGFAYHRVDDPDQWPGEGDFRSQMYYLKDHGYRCIAMRDLSQYIDPEKADRYTR